MLNNAGSIFSPFIFLFQPNVFSNENRLATCCRFISKPIIANGFSLWTKLSNFTSNWPVRAFLPVQHRLGLFFKKAKGLFNWFLVPSYQSFIRVYEDWRMMAFKTVVFFFSPKFWASSVTFFQCAGIVRQRQAIPSSDQGSAATAAAPTDGAPASTRPSTAANEPLPRDAYSQQARLITRSQQQVAANSNKLKQLGRADDNMDDHLLQERRSSSGGHSDSSMKKRVNPLPPSPEALTEECPTCLEGMDSCIDLASIHFFQMLTNIKNPIILRIGLLILLLNCRIHTRKS